MQCYFIPILIGAFQFGIRGGLGSAIVVSFMYLPHVMLHWGGFVEGNLMRFLQIILFNVIGYLTGLKAQKESEEKLRYQKTADELNTSLIKLKDQSEKFEELEEQLRFSERLALVGELTASLAHEVRNPLGSIRGTVEILRDEIKHNEKLIEFFNILIEETERLNKVVENYLSFSKKHVKKIIRFNLGDLLDSIILLISNRAKKEKVTIDIEKPTENILIEADLSQLQQVLINLILNGIQAMPGGGEIKVSISYEDIKEKKVVISIKDNGVGIDEKSIENIFKPFYSTKENGTGLGLSIIKRLVERNGWDLTLFSQVNKGTEFKLGIPLISKN